MKRTRVITLVTLAASVIAGSITLVPAAMGSGAAPEAVHAGHHAATEVSAELAAQLADARVATAKYALDLRKAKKDGYFIITPSMPDMGYHFLNASITGFDVTKPPILVYVKRGPRPQLGAFEWVFPETPAEPPLEGATYGSFAAACHYRDGTFVFTAAEADCADVSPDTGAPFRFWHPDLVTLHVWLWYPNPDGLYAGMNPLVRPFTGA